jgi:hypothetical protein
MNGFEYYFKRLRDELFPPSGPKEWEAYFCREGKYSYRKDWAEHQMHQTLIQQARRNQEPNDEIQKDIKEKPGKNSLVVEKTD